MNEFESDFVWKQRTKLKENFTQGMISLVDLNTFENLIRRAFFFSLFILYIDTVAEKVTAAVRVCTLGSQQLRPFDVGSLLGDTV